MFVINIDDPVELMTPEGIQAAITEALEEERAVILEEHATERWSEVKAILEGEGRHHFFNRVLTKLSSTLRGKAYWAASLNLNVRNFHIKYENLDRFLIGLNYFLGQQADLRYIKNENGHTHELPQPAPERSAFFNFLTNLGEN